MDENNEEQEAIEGTDITSGEEEENEPGIVPKDIDVEAENQSEEKKQNEGQKEESSPEKKESEETDDSVDTEEGDLEEEEEPTLGSDERLLLTFLQVIQENNSPDLEITGFQIKDFFKQVFPDIDVDTSYGILKQENLISDRRDTKPFEVTQDGRNKASEYEDDYIANILDQVVPLVRKQLDQKEQIRRLLWLAYQDNQVFQDYLPEVRPKLEETNQLLTVFFGSNQFLTHPRVERLLREIRTDEHESVQEKLEEFCQDPAFLKAIAVLHPEVVLRTLGIDVKKRTYSGLETALAAWIGDENVGDVLGRLYLLGIDESQNNFNADIEAVIESHKSEIQEWIQFERGELSSRAKKEWNIALDICRAANERSVADIEILLEYGALIPTKDGFRIRDEIDELWEELDEYITGRLEEYVGEIDNVGVVPFFSSRDVVGEIEEDIIVTVHAKNRWSRNHDYYAFIKGNESFTNDPERNVLADKVVLVVSPIEIGFDDDNKKYESVAKSALVESRDKNQEYNAIGDVKELDEVKAAFTQCQWEDASSAAKSAAKEIQNEADIPKISLDEALEEIAELGSEYQEALYIAADKRSSDTAVGKSDYTSDILWDDVQRNLSARYPEIDTEAFEDITETLQHIVTKKAETDLTTFTDTERVYEAFNKTLETQILSRAKQLDVTEQKILAVFLQHPPEYPQQINRDRYLRRFKMLYRFQFDEEFEKSLLSLLTAVGVVTAGTWITSKGKDRGVDYTLFEGFEKIQNQLHSELAVELSQTDITEFKQKYSGNIAELAGLEYLLEEDGLANRDAMRDALLYLSSTAWMEFDSYDGIISSKNEEQILLNPLVENELHEWVTAQKQELLGRESMIQKQLQTADIVDYRISFEEEHGVYLGQVMTADRETVQVVISPWILPDDTSLLGETNLIVITESHSTDARDRLEKLSYEDIMLVTVDEDKFEVYSNLPNESFVESVVNALRKEYELAARELDTPVSEGEATATVGEKDATQSEKKEAVVAEMSNPEGSGSNDISGRLFDELFETEGGQIPADVSRNRPIILLLHSPENDSYGATVQVLCRELYHELKGGLPSGMMRSNSREIQRDLSAGGRIEFIDEENDEFFKGSLGGTNIGTDTIQWDKIRRRLQELFSQDFGFVVFQLPTGLVSMFREKLEDEVSPHKPQIFELKPQLSDVVLDIESEEVRSMDKEKQQLANGLWGYPLDDLDIGSDMFDELFMTYEREFWEQLIELKSRPLSDGRKERSVTQIVNRSPEIEDHPSENESELHFALKAFVTRVLVETEKYGFDSIATEEDTAFARETNNKLIPDIQVGNTVIEVETLYSSGEPMNQIAETIKKYYKWNKNPEINIVLTNLDAFMRFEELKRLQQGIEEDWEMVVNFQVPVLHEQRLVNIDELVDLIPDVE